MKHDRMNQNRSDKSKLTVKILAGVVVVLVLFIAFFFVVQPQMNKYVAEKQIEGAQLFIYQSMVPQIQSTGFAQVPVGNETILLAYVTEAEAQFLQQARAAQAKAQESQGEASEQPAQ